MKFKDKEIKIFKKKKIIDYILYSLTILIGIAIDQLTKYLSVLHLKDSKSITIIENHLVLAYDENTGAAFGMLKDNRWIFLVVSTVTIIGLALYLYLGHAQNKLYGISIAMVVSGGIANMIDRLALGYVVDFIYVPWFANFNVADSFVCVGAGLLILALIIEIVKEYKSTGKIS